MTLGIEYLNALLQEDREQGIYRCKREMFTDPRLFDLEMKHRHPAAASAARS